MAAQKKAEERLNKGRRRTIAACILLSLVFWISIKLSNDYVSTERIRVEYDLPQGVGFANEPPRMVEATIEASGWDLLRQWLVAGDRSIQIDSIDLSRNPDGMISIKREVSEAFRREGLSVQALTDERVVIVTEQLSTKRVPLRLVSQIDYASGFSSATEPTLTPDSVTLSGPASRIEAFTSWDTDTLRLSAVADTVMAVLSPARPEIPSIRVNPSTVEVVVESQQFTERSFLVPVDIEGAEEADSMHVFPRQVLVTFAVGLDHYRRVEARDFRVVVNVMQQKMQSGKLDVPVIISRAPDYVRQVQVEPRFVELFKVKPLEN